MLDVLFAERPACLEEDPEIFFAGERDAADQASAKSACAGCPALPECRCVVDQLESTLGYFDWWGIWAGETPQERWQRRRGQARPKRPRILYRDSFGAFAVGQR